MKMKKTNLTYIRMKRLFLSFLTLLTMELSAQNVEQPAESADTLSQEQKELVFTFAEQFMWNYNTHSISVNYANRVQPRYKFQNSAISRGNYPEITAHQ